MDFLLFLRNGKRVARQALASLIRFDNSSTSLASDNIQDAIVEIATFTGAAAQFSFSRIKDGQAVIVPDCQQMILCDEFCIDGEGELCVEGDGSIALI